MSKYFSFIIIIRGENNLYSYTRRHEYNQRYAMWGKKLHRFFAVALSELYLLWQFLAHIEFNKFPFMHIFHIFI